MRRGEKIPPEGKMVLVLTNLYGREESQGDTTFPFLDAFVEMASKD